MYRTNRRSLVAGAVSALLLPSLALLLEPSSSAAAADNHAAGHVYVLNNNLSGANSITVFTRAADGALTQMGSTAIGGLGSVAAFADGTQGSLILTPNMRRLFAVTAGSDQISVVDGLLYVLNAANASTAAANVAGFHIDARGRLHPIAGATQPLSAPHPNPAQVLLDPRRRFLLVTEKGTNLIDVYRVANDGSLSRPTPMPSVGAVPFGMAFDPASQQSEFLVADAAGGPNGTGATTAYCLTDGQVRLITGPVTKPAGRPVLDGHHPGRAPIPAARPARVPLRIPTPTRWMTSPQTTCRCDVTSAMTNSQGFVRSECPPSRSCASRTCCTRMAIRTTHEPPIDSHHGPHIGGAARRLSVDGENLGDGLNRQPKSDEHGNRH